MLKRVLVLTALCAALAGAAARYGDNVLKYGSRDADFAADYFSLLQTDLEQLGYGPYLLESGKLELVFGPATAAAVKAFQRDWSLNETGVVNAETALALERALAGESPPKLSTFPALTLEAKHDVVAKAGKGVVEIKITPEAGVVYVFTGEGECQACEIITPYGTYAPTATPPADVIAALKALGDEGKAVIFADGEIPGAYVLSVEAINDLKDIPVTVRVYRLTRTDAGEETEGK